MKKILMLIIFLLLGPISPVFVSANQFSMDKDFSPHCSSNNFLALQDIIFNLQSRLPYDKRELPKDFSFLDLLKYSKSYQYSALSDWKSGIPKMAIRAAELGLIWQPLSLITSTTQHEVFGHGYRARSLGPSVATIQDYVLNFKVGWKGLEIKNAAIQLILKKTISPTELISIDLAGVEGNLILGHNIVMSWLEKGEMDGRQAYLWRDAHFDTANYIRTLKKYNGYNTFLLAQTSGHDIANYLINLNRMYPSFKSLDEQLQSLQTKSILSRIFNPMTYLSYCSELSYILFRSSLPIPGIKVQETLFLPSYHLALSPFGPEDVFEVYIWGKGKSPSYIYFKTFELIGDNYFGLGFENSKIISTKWGSLGLKINLWLQPEMKLYPMYYEIEYYTPFKEKGGFAIFPAIRSWYLTKSFGGSSSLIYNHVLPNRSSCINVELGYKTQGYLPGEPLLRSPIAKFGLQAQF